MKIWVVDSSALIECKTRIAVDEQWGFFSCLTSLVEAGKLALSRQVINELSGSKWPDMPGAWAAAARKLHVLPLDAPPQYLRDVLRVTPDVLEQDASDDVADPHVLALALLLNEVAPNGEAIVIVTEDAVDRLPLKRSMRSAAEMHGLQCCSLEEFAVFVGYKCKKRSH